MPDTANPPKEAIEARHRQASRAAQGNDNVHYHTRANPAKGEPTGSAGCPVRGIDRAASRRNDNRANKSGSPAPDDKQTLTALTCVTGFPLKPQPSRGPSPSLVQHGHRLRQTRRGRLGGYRTAPARYLLRPAHEALAIPVSARRANRGVERLNGEERSGNRPEDEHRRRKDRGRPARPEELTEREKRAGGVRCPDPLLVDQVVQEATALGLEVTRDNTDPQFRRGHAILVTNIFKLINGKSRFGVGPRG